LYLNMENTGSFGSAIGGLTPELQAAMQSRQGNPNAGATSQVSNTAPTSDPSSQVPPMQGGMPPQAQAPQQASQQAPLSPSGLPFDPSDAKIILGAMGGWLKTLSKSAGV